VNNFSKSWKLVFVAAIVLILVGMAPQWNTPAFAQPLRTPTANWAISYAVSQSVDQERRLSPGPIIGLICAIAASSVALGVAFGLRRRIDRIAGPDTEKGDED
jgi:hypothetical protein